MSWPYLPTELVERILEEAWNGPLSIDERINLMTSSVLVNTTWLLVFTRVASRNVHIPCASYADQFFRILREESPIYPEDFKSLPDYLCRTLTFHLSHTSTYPDLDGSTTQSGLTLANTLYTIQTLGYLPNLRKVSIECVDELFDDLVDQYRLVSFPDQVTELALKYSFAACMPPWLKTALRSCYKQRVCLPWSLPSIRRLSIQGAGGEFVADLLSVCPQVETVETDAIFPIDTITPLPGSVDTLILRLPTDSRLTQQGIEMLQLKEALDRGIFTSADPQVIILGSVDQIYLEELRIQCSAQGVRLIYGPSS